jgi:hypothetical protein
LTPTAVAQPSATVSSAVDFEASNAEIVKNFVWRIEEVMFLARNVAPVTGPAMLDVVSAEAETIDSGMTWKGRADPALTQIGEAELPVKMVADLDTWTAEADRTMVEMKPVDSDATAVDRVESADRAPDVELKVDTDFCCGTAVLDDESGDPDSSSDLATVRTWFEDSSQKLRSSFSKSTSSLLDLNLASISFSDSQSTLEMAAGLNCTTSTSKSTSICRPKNLLQFHSDPDFAFSESIFLLMLCECVLIWSQTYET